MKLSLMDAVFTPMHTHIVLCWLRDLFCHRKYNYCFWKLLQIKKTLGEILDRKNAIKKGRQWEEWSGWKGKGRWKKRC